MFWSARRKSWVVVDVSYPKHVSVVAICDSNFRISVTLVEHTPIEYSCDLDSYGVVNGVPSCRNKWYFQESVSITSRPKVNTCVIESGNW